MYAYPAIAPDSSNHLLGTTSVITYINYQPQIINYSTWDDSATEVLRVTSIPLKVKVDGNEISQLNNLTGEGWTWTPYNTGGVLTINHTSGHNVQILWTLASVNQPTRSNDWMEISPNPASDVLKIKYTLNNSGAVSIQVANMLGQTVMSNASNAVAGQNITRLNLSGLEPGTFLVHLLSAEGQLVKKLIVAR
jgi:Secretion system C-terminal sorting domain